MKSEEHGGASASEQSILTKLELDPAGEFADEMDELTMDSGQIERRPGFR
jgi:hypothetical protein